ncbi:MAG: Nif11-like leader peptide family RiPP precursor [Lachnospiraceae bacterium]|nr:Nif11-like leader peptide family RiPP precursor [Lachnospiraceae bacterium]
MKEFLEAVEKNEELKAKVDALSNKPDAVPADFIALAKEYGFTLTEADFAEGKTEGEITEDELEAVAGGGACACTLGGGGNPSDTTQTCYCVFAGAGYRKTGGEGLDARCVCPLVGGGTAD